MTTDEIDHITAEQRKELMGYCEHCEVWEDVDGRAVHSCGNKWSAKNGHQITSKRTFNAVKRK